MRITIEADAKEIAALALGTQERPKDSGLSEVNTAYVDLVKQYIKETARCSLLGSEQRMCAIKDCVQTANNIMG